MSLRAFAASALVLAGALVPRPAAASAHDDRELHRIVTLLQYVAEEYDEALEEGVETEIVEQQKIVATLPAAVAAVGARGGPYAAQVASIADRVAQRADPVGVSRDCSALALAIVDREKIATHPASPPDLARGRTVFTTVCSQCHDRATFLARPDHASITPVPPTFHESDLVNHLSPFRAFDFVTFGVPGTAMAPFGEALSETDRWAVAFYIHTLRQPPCEGPRPDEPLARTATMTDQEIVVAHGESGLACLRWAPSAAASAPPTTSLPRIVIVAASLLIVGLALVAAYALRSISARRAGGIAE